MEADSRNIFIGGIDFQMSGNGGEGCVSYLIPLRRFLETFIAIAFSCLCINIGFTRLTIPSQSIVSRKDRGGKRILLILLCLVFGIEIGFKFATRSLIFILNPCHVTTAFQIYLLAAPPSPSITPIFRVHLNCLNGAVLALLFPVTNTRMLSFETEIYYLQHILMLIVPYYLLRLGGVYTLEDYGDFSWPCLSYGILLLYHFTVLQSIGLYTQVNLNSMVCPAVSDPFYGPNYRLFAILHQIPMIPLVSKGYRLIANFLLTRCPFTKVKDKLEAELALGAYRTTSISCVNNPFHYPLAANGGEKCNSKKE